MINGRVRVGSIILERKDGGNITISAAHVGGLVHNGVITIERADRFDLLDALGILLEHDARTPPVRVEAVLF